MTTTHQGEIRPTRERIEAALILAESATGILEKRDCGNLDYAAQALLQAGLILSGRENDLTHIIANKEYTQIHEALIMAGDALGAIAERENNPGPTNAIVGLVHRLLIDAERQFDESGICIEIPPVTEDSTNG